MAIENQDNTPDENNLNGGENGLNYRAYSWEGRKHDADNENTPMYWNRFYAETD